MQLVVGPKHEHEGKGAHDAGGAREAGEPRRGEQQGDRAAAHADADVEEAPLEANVSRVATCARSGANRQLVRVRAAAVT